MSLLKKISSLILLLAFSFQCFNKAFIVVDYCSNTAQYAKECINKSRPKLHCNGRCAMMKKLNADEKKDADNPERKQENKNETFSPFLLNYNLIVVVRTTMVQKYPVLDDNATCKMPRSNFRPPRMA